MYQKIVALNVDQIGGGVIAVSGSAPSWLLTASLWAVSFTGVIVFVNVFTKWGPFKFVWERLVTGPRREELVSVIDQHIKPVMEHNRVTLETALAELRPNGGGSLRDALDKLHQDVRENNDAAVLAVKSAENAAHAAEGAVEASERAAAKVDAFERYQHDRNHDILNHMTVVSGFTRLLDEKVTGYMVEDAAAHEELRLAVVRVVEQLEIDASVDEHGRAHEIERRKE